MKTRFFSFCLTFLFLLPLSAQEYTVSGYVQDTGTGEKLIGANVFCPGILSGTTTNSYGFYSITLPAGEYKITYSFIGYQSSVQKVSLSKDVRLDINLEPSLELDEVTVTAERNRAVESTQMSTIHIPVKQIKKIPALLGEVDLIKAIQLLPGVQSGTEGASGLYVRGGGPDQNLILLDGTPVYNVSHLFGFFSVFNTDAVNNIELIKGGFPARYGGRLSSVLDISLKEGNMKKIKGTGSLGIISAKFTIEGPVVKDKTSFIVSARRTYLDYLVQPFIRTLGDEDPNTSQGYFFYDLNAKINHKFSFKDRLYLSVYTGTDKFYRRRKPYTYLYDGVYYTDESKSDLGWGNITAALRWNHQFTGKLFSNTTFTYSHYDFHVKEFSKNIVRNGDSTTNEINSLSFLSGIDDFTAKVDFDFLPSPDHFVRFGMNHTYHIFRPGASVFKIAGKKQATEAV
ncbi:MAG: TonB-dependent receptor [Chlorobi bacterium]|nr:TonB-dependent receptor [Chlorobiota bacterium]